MSDVPIGEPRALGIHERRLQVAFDLLRRWTEEDRIPGATLCVGRRGRMLEPRFFGKQRPGAGAPELRQDALFLIASITKPVTVGALMLLVERGQIGLEDRVAQYVPRFAANGKGDVQIRHLLTHTSGLPDQLPNNEALRAAHRPFSAFIDAVCELPLAFPVGMRVSYQSMGTAMAAEIVHQVSGVALPEFLRREFFQPLGMSNTALGWGMEGRERIAVVRISPEQARTNWHWNSPYWLGFGAPWGGLITSPADFAKYCQMMLSGGALGETRIFSPATVRTMTMNQLAAMPQVPEEERRCRPWGLGWRLNWPAHSANFGDLVGLRAYGHWGATGTLCWIDPDTEAFFILFTTQPQEPEGRYLSRVSNAVAAALI
ncbi:MAG: beta-lactamase family protein [Gemmataceae bacterium]|nr:beta-lactamase family protein [Gemmataceae bacterium]